MGNASDNRVVACLYGRSITYCFPVNIDLDGEVIGYQSRWAAAITNARIYTLYMYEYSILDL